MWDAVYAYESPRRSGSGISLVRRKPVYYTTQVPLKLTCNDSVRLTAVN